MCSKELYGVDPSKYVVLDVETNGLSSLQDDLLSISIYKPDTGEMYDRFLPLELNPFVVATQYNGIKTEDLLDLFPLSQQEVDEIIQKFDLKNRIILTFGSLDERFITKYFLRHRLKGLDYFAFYNFKHEIISSSFSGGNVTKDNLCRLYGIENVLDVHSSSSDCVLEWNLFERMNGHRLFITNDSVFEFNDEYIIPAGMLHSHPNLKYYLPDMPTISCESQIVFSLPVAADKLKVFPTNFYGMIVEHLINSMIHVQKIDSTKELIDNKKKLKYLGDLPSPYDIVPMVFNPDGSMTATRPQDRELSEEINTVILSLKSEFNPLITFILNDIFHGQPVKSQELMVDQKNNVLALCDLSSEDAVLEIKASKYACLQDYTEQLFFEANGRKCYILMTDWSYYPNTVSFDIHEVDFSVKEYADPRQARFDEARKKIETYDVDLVSYVNTVSPVRLRCRNCGHEWLTSYKIAKKQRGCPNCRPYEEEKRRRVKKDVPFEEKSLTPEEKKTVNLYLRSKAKVERRSGNQITILSYKDSKTPVQAKCLKCGHEWEILYNRLLDNLCCPSCMSSPIVQRSILTKNVRP